MKLKTEVVARLCHEANRAFCEATGIPKGRSWAASPQYVRDFAMMSIDVQRKYSTATPAQLQEKLIDEQFNRNWVFLNTPSGRKKQEAVLPPYHQMTAKQKAKSYHFQAMVATLI